MNYELHHGDCLEVSLPDASVDCVLTDPPYPNGAGHFVEGIEAARRFLQTFRCDRWFVFWDEMEIPPVPLPLVARHIWHRNNTNRPDNYEAIYEFHVNGIKRASRVFPFPVIYPGLTGCKEATDHPTQKNQKMIRALIRKCQITGTILDPFMGSGTVGAAAILEDRYFIGIEKNEQYFNVASERLRRAATPEPLFMEVAA